MLDVDRCQSRRIGGVADDDRNRDRPGAGDLARQMPAREQGLAVREALSPVVAYWPSEIGALNRFIHVYVYTDLAERASVRKRMAETRQPAAPGAIRPIRQENKLLIPAAFSPLK